MSNEQHESAGTRKITIEPSPTPTTGLNVASLVEATQKTIGPSQTVKDLTKQLGFQNNRLKEMFAPLSGEALRHLNPSRHIEEVFGSTDKFQQIMRDITAPSSAFQVSSMNDVMENSMRAVQSAKAEERAMARKALASQVEAAEHLDEMRETQKTLTDAVTALLKHSLDATREQAEALRAREAIEEKRSNTNTTLSRVAAWSGVIAALLAAGSFLWQVTH